MPIVSKLTLYERDDRWPGVRQIKPSTSNIIDQMNSALASLQAQQTLRTMNHLRDEVESFALHAKALNATSSDLDSRLLLQEAGLLLQKLGAARSDFQNADSAVGSLSRALSSRLPERGGMPAAAQWGNPLRAGSKQFSEAVSRAERELERLYKTAVIGMNSPKRTATSPDNAVDVLVNFTEALSHWIEHCKRIQHR